MRRVWLGALMAAVALTAAPAVPAHRDQAIHALEGRAIDDIEGVWRWPDDGAEIAILRLTADTYSIVALHTGNFHPAPGTVIGKATATAQRHRYRASIATSLGGSGVPGRHRDFIIDVSDASRLALTPVRSGLRVDLWRLIPYLFRVSVSRRPTNTEGLDGALRVYPRQLTTAPVEL